MFGAFILEALVGAPSGGEVREANEKAAQKSHARPSALNSKKRAMIAARGRSYLDQGGTTPLVRAYAIDCPRCSC